jgi:hypothetical protein
MITDEVLMFMHDKATDTYALDNDEARAFASLHNIPHSAQGDAGWYALVAACKGICEIDMDDAQ